MTLADSLFSVYVMKKIFTVFCICDDKFFQNIAYFGSFNFHIINPRPKFSESNKA